MQKDYVCMEATQLSLFDFPKIEINKPIRLIELFGGIGSQAMALRDIGADFEHYKLVEFDRYAVQSYNAIHGTQHITHDIRQIHATDLEIKDKDKYCYLMTYSFPCTDLSVAGKMQGMSKADWENGNSTRSGLLWEVERILKECKREELPQILLMENVPQVHAEQNKADFESWLSFLRIKGYYNHWKDLNAKDYGIPQNRDRCFCVSILADEFVDYEFPAPMPLTTVMKDFLEETVEEKYYITTEKANKLISQLVESGAISAQSSEKVKVKVIGQMDNTLDNTLESANRVYDKGALYPTIPTCCGGGHQPKIIDKICVAMRGRNPEKPIFDTQNGVIEFLNPEKDGTCRTIKTQYFKNSIANFIRQDSLGATGVVEIKQATKEGSIKCKVGGCYDASYPDSKTRRGRVQNGGDVTPTITAQGGENINYIETQYRIRKLTPKECWRLMGYTDEDFEKAKGAGVSNSQLYKQAGNAIVKQVLMAIFAQMIPSAGQTIAA